MATRSTIAEHPDHEAIKRELLAGMSASAVARLHDLARSPVARYRRKLLADESRKPKPVTRDTLLEQAQALQTMCAGLVNQARKAGQPSQFIAASKEMRGCLTLLARIVGVLSEQPQVTVNTAVQVDVVRLQNVVLEALADHPEARQRVAAALLVDSEAADGA